jgi:hypothetical protein
MFKKTGRMNKLSKNYQFSKVSNKENLDGISLTKLSKLRDEVIN